MAPVQGFLIVAGEKAPYHLLYDGECALCRRWVRRVQRWDREDRMELLPFQNPSRRERFPEVPEEDLRAAVQLLGPQGERWQGARAVEEILKLLPGWGWLARILRLPLLRPVADRVYRLVARNRHLLGCREHCSPRTPSGPMP